MPNVSRVAFGVGGKECDKLLERFSGLFALLFLQLANAPPKQQVLTVRYLNGGIAGESFPNRIESLGKFLQTQEAHCERIAHLPDGRLGLESRSEVRDELSIKFRGLGVVSLCVA
jgi:hypothetical protein